MILLYLLIFNLLVSFISFPTVKQNYILNFKLFALNSPNIIILLFGINFLTIKIHKGNFCNLDCLSINSLEQINKDKMYHVQRNHRNEYIKIKKINFVRKNKTLLQMDCRQVTVMLKKSANNYSFEKHYWF